MDIFDLFNKIKKENTVVGSPQYLIVGLGNPGRQYEKTRHNAGFLVLDFLAQEMRISINKLKFKGLCGEGMINGKRVVLLKPQTFMNLSGESVAEAVKFYRVPMENVLVIYDDISLSVGKLRIRDKGSAGGHNGMKSILYHMNTAVFPRIKIGVGQKPENYQDLADWVLSSFNNEEMTLFPSLFKKISEATELIIAGKIAESMNRFNGS